MATVKKMRNEVKEIAWCKSTLEKLPWGKVALHYDQEADVLYIHLKPHSGAAKAKELAKEGILLEYADGELIGIIVLDASQR